MSNQSQWCYSINELALTRQIMNKLTTLYNSKRKNLLILKLFQSLFDPKNVKHKHDITLQLFCNDLGDCEPCSLFSILWKCLYKSQELLNFLKLLSS